MQARTTPDGPVLVSADNFTRAESDLYFSNIVKDGGFGKFTHIRELTPLDKQLVVRSNRDTLYSAGVFDLDAGPVTVSLPEPGGRFMSMQVITEDHYVPAVFYGQGEHTLTRGEIGTRYVMVAIRILVNPNDDADLAEVHALQDPRSMRYKTPSRCSRTTPAASTFQSGIRSVRRRYGTRFFNSRPLCPTPSGCSAPKTTQTRCDG